MAQLLAGDLDWVVMKALEKDRNRRYDTPRNFAEDIDRYLRREAILARPPSAVYKVRKFTQRHRAAVLTGSVIAAALLVGAAIATWQAVVATRAKQDALAAAAEKEAREMAQVREAETKAVLEFVENRVFAAARPARQDGGLGRDAAGCRQTAEMWENLKRTDADSLYNAARMWAVTAAILREADKSSEGGKLAEADRALAWLKQAVAAGYKDAAHMKQDKDLDALRDRADFTKLVTMLEGTRD